MSSDRLIAAMMILVIWQEMLYGLLKGRRDKTSLFEANNRSGVTVYGVANIILANTISRFSEFHH